MTDFYKNLLQLNASAQALKDYLNEIPSEDALKVLDALVFPDFDDDMLDFASVVGDQVRKDRVATIRDRLALDGTSRPETDAEREKRKRQTASAERIVSLASNALARLTKTRSYARVPWATLASLFSSTDQDDRATRIRNLTSSADSDFVLSIADVSELILYYGLPRSGYVQYGYDVNSLAELEEREAEIERDLIASRDFRRIVFGEDEKEIRSFLDEVDRKVVALLEILKDDSVKSLRRVLALRVPETPLSESGNVEIEADYLRALRRAVDIVSARSFVIRDEEEYETRVYDAIDAVKRVAERSEARRERLREVYGEKESTDYGEKESTEE